MGAKATREAKKNVQREKPEKKEEPLPLQPQTSLQPLSEERSCAEALMMACDERLGAQSPAALMVCDTFLARDFWKSFVHQSFLPPAASQVWACGNNDFGQLGIGHTKARTTPTEVTTLHDRCIHAVACGWYQTMVVVDGGELWATGTNADGELGLGDTQFRSTFTRVIALSGRKVAAVACGRKHVSMLLESGELFACGDNEHGQLGLGDTTDRTTPEPVTALSGRRVAAIACGCWDHSVAVLKTGDLFSWGFNNRGQLGLGDNTDHNEPTQVTALAGRRVVAVACGTVHTAAVLESGELFTWGWNAHGELGHGDRTERGMPQIVEALRGRPVIGVACGDYHTLALLKTGEVFAWGSHRDGQLGLGDSFLNRIVAAPQQVHFFDGIPVLAIFSGHLLSGAVLKSGELFLWGYNGFFQLGTVVQSICSTPQPVLGMYFVTSIGIGFAHVVAAKRAADEE